MKRIQETENHFRRPGLSNILKEFSEKIIVPTLETQRHNNIMLLVGSDFAYISNPVRIGQQDKGNFRLIDSLIETLI